ncbi:cupredoxin family copper-binding protein [Candidatus Pacearchaeota archaeon]|nr:cupredoxin family copper-binding protein [Candidatus Pacearchaeota archaeon]
MRVIYPILIIVIAILLFGAVYYIYSNNSLVDQAPPTGASGNSQYNVEIKESSFNPSEITINKGETITWTNYDSAPHTITSDSNKALDSPTLNQGETFSYTFETSGNYNYHCSFHSSMKGKIIVRE